MAVSETGYIRREGSFGSQIQHSYIHPLDIDVHASRYFDEELERKIYLDEQLALFYFTSLARGYMTKILNDIPLSDDLIRFFDRSPFGHGVVEKRTL